MKVTKKGAAAIVGATVAGLLAISSPGEAAQVSFSGSGNRSNYIAATSSHCITAYGSVSYGWDSGDFYAYDHDTGVRIFYWHIPFFGPSFNSRICGLYGSHYYITGTSGGPIQGGLYNS